ncbi:MAG: FecCD family ABC transporter permease [Blastocatellia bacterium]
MNATPPIMAAHEHAAPPRRAGRDAWFFAVALALLLTLIILGISVGATYVPPGVVARVLCGNLIPLDVFDLASIHAGQQAIIRDLRAPRVISAALVGAALALAGAQMQGLFRNALASPDIIGTSAGGALGAVIAMMLGLAMRSVLALPLFSIAGAMLALFAVYALATRQGRTPVATLLLVGVALSALLSATSSFLISLSWTRWEVAQEIIFWLMGGLDNRQWTHCLLVAPFVAVGFAVAMACWRDLDLLLTGEETALALGVDTERTKRVLLFNAALLTGAAVAVSGVVGFAGLIAPHLARLLTRPSHRVLLPASALTGAIFLLAADLLARLLIRPEEIRLGIVTAMAGAPFFLFLLLRQRQ